MYDLTVSLFGFWCLTLCLFFMFCMSGNGIYDRFFKEQSKTALEGIGHLFSL